ncbi:nickel-binding protein [Autumnicola psychrophila]|uniref:DUF4242 domain-containing protein n=1 Tax=Autumnicola psychrophila TaxID=3075592 RepID=A0ABU3DQP3_9FLAO|nr:nickel-binding protein [Zunongwangia sp. F225]MDT0686016.1 DUF4242 domain-containing protein [Zunongwangia sp. F225]
MPIYMDRHDVSAKVTAEIVADLHQKDLKIQHRFNCKGLTYWFDDKRKTAFCLIEAPNKAALKKMHDHAHGEVPNRIIEVDNAVVESFLGRIEDPEKSQKAEVNIINDPAFRTVMVVGITPGSPELILDKNVNSNIAEQHNIISSTISSFNGRLVKRNQDYLLISFISVTKAFECALKLQSLFQKRFGRKPGSPFKLKVGLDAGLPVEDKNGFFEDTIETAFSYFKVVKGTVVLSAEVKELYESENLNVSIRSGSVVALNRSDDKFLKELMNFTGKNFSNPSLNTNDFCQYLGSSKSKCYRKIVALTGKSPNSFIKNYRLNKSLELLKTRDWNISEVAFETGFNSLAYFSKCFQDTFRILPSQYIKFTNQSYSG